MNESIQIMRTGPRLLKPLTLLMLLLGPLLASQLWAEGPARAPVPVRLVSVKAVESAAQETATGTLSPRRMLQLGFEVGGRLKESRVTKGDVVREGQVLGVLDTEVSDAQLAQAEAGVLAAEAAAALASDVAGRQEELGAQGTISQVAQITASTQAKQAQAQLKSAKAGLAQARAGRNKHELKAPFAGTLIDAPEQVGGMVGPGAPVYVLHQLHPLILKTTIPETLRDALVPGQKVRVESVGGTSSTDEATIRLLLPVADAQTRRIPIEIFVPNLNRAFVANTMARVRFPLGKPKTGYRVPNSAMSYSGGEHVFEVDGQNTLRRIDVQVLERSGSEVTVQSPKPLTQLVDLPTGAFSDGMPVKVK